MTWRRKTKEAKKRRYVAGVDVDDVDDDVVVVAAVAVAAVVEIDSSVGR